MNANEFLRSLTAEQIRQISDAADISEDAARGYEALGPAFLHRMEDRLARDYPGIFLRIQAIPRA